jgi:hypothetical protein
MQEEVATAWLLVVWQVLVLLVRKVLLVLLVLLALLARTDHSVLQVLEVHLVLEILLVDCLEESEIVSLAVVHLVEEENQMVDLVA